MKKILLIIAIVFSLNSFSQSIDTVTISSVQLMAKNWVWAVGKYGEGTDSVSRVRIRQIRTAIKAINPATWETNVTINNVPGSVVIYIYQAFMYAASGEVLAMGNTQAERYNIYTVIRAINNPALQYHIGVTDASTTNNYNNSIKSGKTILLDN